MNQKFSNMKTHSSQIVRTEELKPMRLGGYKQIKRI